MGRLTSLFALMLACFVPLTSTAAPAVHSPTTGDPILLLAENHHKTYKSFADLAAHEAEGVDYRIVIDDRSEKSDTLIVAIHGGDIEPGTGRAAIALASDKHSRYLFEGIKDKDNWNLHLTSTQFDEPRLLVLLKKHDYVISLHGFRDRVQNQQSVLIGGLDKRFRMAAEAEFDSAGFDTICPGDDDYIDELNGGGDTNICNMARVSGLQLEISRSLRKRLVEDAELMNRFTAAIDAALVRMRNS